MAATPQSRSPLCSSERQCTDLAFTSEETAWRARGRECECWITAETEPRAWRHAWRHAWRRARRGAATDIVWGSLGAHQDFRHLHPHLSSKRFCHGGVPLLRHAAACRLPRACAAAAGLGATPSPVQAAATGDQGRKRSRCGVAAAPPAGASGSGSGAPPLPTPNARPSLPCLRAASSSRAADPAAGGAAAAGGSDSEDEYLELPEAQHWAVQPSFLDAADELRAHFEER